MTAEGKALSSFEQFASKEIDFICSGFVREFGARDGMDGAEITFSPKEVVLLYSALQYLKGAVERAAAIDRKLTNRDVLDAIEGIGTRPLLTEDGKAIQALQDRFNDVMQDDMVSCTLLFLPIDAAIIVQAGNFWASVPSNSSKSNESQHGASITLCEKLADSAICGVETDLEDYSFVQRLILASDSSSKSKSKRH